MPEQLKEQGTEARDFLGELLTEGLLTTDQRQLVEKLVYRNRILYKDQRQLISEALKEMKSGEVGVHLTLLALVGAINSFPPRT